MKPNQKLTPKYWVVHDKKTDDVFIGTAAKGLLNSLELFFEFYAYDYSGKVVADEDLQQWFNDEPNLECVLVEVNLVQVH